MPVPNTFILTISNNLVYIKTYLPTDIQLSQYNIFFVNTRRYIKIRKAHRTEVNGLSSTTCDMVELKSWTLLQKGPASPFWVRLRMRQRTSPRTGDPRDA